MIDLRSLYVYGVVPRHETERDAAATAAADDDEREDAREDEGDGGEHHEHTQDCVAELEVLHRPVGVLREIIHLRIPDMKST